MSYISQLSLSSIAVGQRLGDYHLIRYLGEGASATIYLAEHRYLQNPVAIKVFRTCLENEQLQVMWTEVHLAARLIHPHIVPMFDFDVIDGVSFLVMEYAPHGTLRSRHETGRVLAPDLVCYYVSQIASALQCMHNHGFIHQDVKPENVLIGHGQQVLLSDFGISIAMQDVQARKEIKPAGTILYTAPEQIQGRPCLASDQYALAILAYEWLCGRVPFRGTAYAVARQHLYAEPASIRTAVPTLPASMERVVLKALAKDPRQRFAQIEEFALALELAYRDVASTASRTVASGFSFRNHMRMRPTEILKCEEAVSV